MDVIAGANMNVLLFQLIRQHAGYCAGLGDFFGFQALTLEHVHEVCVPAKVELIRMIQLDAAVHKQTSQHAVHNGGTHLALDVIADDGQTTLAEPLSPIL